VVQSKRYDQLDYPLCAPKHFAMPNWFVIPVTFRFIFILAFLFHAIQSPASEVIAWGDARFGQTDFSATNISTIRASATFTAALTRAGKVQIWGTNDFVTAIPDSAANLVDLTVGENHCLGLRRDGTIVVWGTNANGITNAPPGLTNIIAIAAGPQHSLALRSDRTVVAWGLHLNNRTNVPSGLVNVVAISAGAQHNLALQANGRVVAWGGNSLGESTVPESLTNAVMVSAGNGFSMALRSDGKVVVWGDNSAGQRDLPAGLTNILAIAAGDKHCLALAEDRTVVAWGSNAYGQTDVPSTLQKVNGISAGKWHSAALFGEAALWFVDAPVSLSAYVTSTVHLRGWASTGLPVRYQWKHSGTNLPGATLPILTLSSIQPEAAGNYSLVVSNALSSLESPAVTLEVLPLPSLGEAVNAPHLTWTTSSQPWISQVAVAHDGVAAARSALVGLSQQTWIQTSVTGPGTLNFWWLSRGGERLRFLIDGNEHGFISYSSWRQQTYYLGPGTQALRWIIESTTFPTIPERDAGYLDEVTFEPGGVEPFILTNPPNQTVLAGTNVTLRVSANGTPPLLYQWYHEEEPISGANAAVHVVTNAQGEAAGAYHAVVNNDYGTVISTAALLVVNESAPHFFVQPATRTAHFGEELKLVSTDIGSDPRTYEWRFQGQLLDGIHENTLEFPAVTSTQAGAYSVLASNHLGQATSSEFHLHTVPVAVWGFGFWGQTNLQPQFTNFMALAVGSTHCLGLTMEGRIVGWGNGFFGSSEIPVSLSNVVAIAAGSHYTLALSADGRVTGWGSSTVGPPPSDLTNAVAVACTDRTALALRTDGTVTGWGYNLNGQASPPLGLKNVRAIAIGRAHALALKADGTVTGWGANTSGQLIFPPGLTNIVAITCGRDHSLALTSEGKILAWGRNTYGQTDVPEHATGVVAIAAGDDHSFALTGDGRLIGWGGNLLGVLDIPPQLPFVWAIASNSRTSAALLNETAPRPSMEVIVRRLNEDKMELIISTLSGKVYDLESKSSLDETLWTHLALSAGTGKDLRFRVPVETDGTRFYRVREW
jgi:alpha-tubulin suppressor-like RCC1 family protein